MLKKLLKSLKSSLFQRFKGKAKISDMTGLSGDASNKKGLLGFQASLLAFAPYLRTLTLFLILMPPVSLVLSGLSLIVFPEAFKPLIAIFLVSTGLAVTTIVYLALSLFFS